MQSLLADGEVRDALDWAKKLQAASAFDAQCAESLLKAARGWHALNLLAAQQEACELVLSALPEYYEALHLLGYIAQTRGEMAQAENYYSRALARRPDFAFSRLALAQMRMLRTQFAEGRDGYEARFEAVTEGSGADWRGLPIARWRGEPLEGKKMYIWAEQGLGDIAMFAGFLPFVRKQSPARAVLAMPPKLIALFARSFPAFDIEPIDDAIHHALGPSVLTAFAHIEKLSQLATVPFSIEPLRAAHAYVQRHGLFDFAAPMGDLLVYAMPGFTPARQASPYLVADRERVASIRGRLKASGEERLVGISWHTTNLREQSRNIALEEWLPLLATAGCRFVSLQHHADPVEIRRFCAAHGCNIVIDDQIDPLADADGLAALIAAQDVVVTIDNSNAHLAGALGVPTALLLPKGCNYRWPVLAEEKTLWYNSLTVLRQHVPYDWRPVMEAAVAYLKKSLTDV